MKKLELIDFLKGFSIITIVFYHYLQYLNLPEPFNKMILFGGTGVHLFVLLSGFGLYMSYLNRPQKYATYIKRRFSKVYIPYIVAVLMAAAISFILPVYDVSIYSFFGHIFLFKMFDESIIGSYGYPLWFISLIFQFYFVFYVIIYFKRKVNNITFLIYCLLISLAWAMLVTYLGKNSLRVWNSFFLQYLWEFALGMVLASIVYQRKIVEIKWKPTVIFIVAFVFTAVYGFLALLPGGTGKLFNDVPALIGYTSLALWVYLIGNHLVNKFLLFTGRISYSLYLLHILVFTVLSISFTEIPLPLTVIMALLISYLSSFFYQLAFDPIYKKLKI